jgi:cleavage and polyadenylation specificity factor subunit 2
LAPKKLIIVGGAKSSTEMKDYCLNSKKITDEIITPGNQETVPVSAATNLYQVVLTDSLVSSLRLSQVFKSNQLNEYSLAYVSGIIRSEDTPEGPRLYLDPVPPNELKQRKPMTVGDLKLSELNKHISQQGFETQFAPGGVLVVNNKFVIKKSDEGITINGSVHPDYYKLRELIYNFQALLAN